MDARLGVGVVLIVLTTGCGRVEGGSMGSVDQAGGAGAVLEVGGSGAGDPIVSPAEAAPVLEAAVPPLPADAPTRAGTDAQATEPPVPSGSAAEPTATAARVGLPPDLHVDPLPPYVPDETTGEPSGSKGPLLSTNGEALQRRLDAIRARLGLDGDAGVADEGEGALRDAGAADAQGVVPDSADANM